MCIPNAEHVLPFPLCFLGVDPDDTYNETPYEKGFCFVSYLAHLVGDQKRFDDFLKVIIGLACLVLPFEQTTHVTEIYLSI